MVRLKLWYMARNQPAHFHFNSLMVRLKLRALLSASW